MLLLEEVEGWWVPATPPVTGVYDRYGRIELYDRRAPAHAEWVGATLELLWEEELLRSTNEDGLDHQRRLGTRQRSSSATRPTRSSTPSAWS